MLPRTVFYWLTSFGCAAVGYGLLWMLLPGHHVFGAPYRMFLYHEAHPLAYIALCCGCFGPLAAATTDVFRRCGRWGRVGVVGLLALATVGLSSPLGGLLWHWHDMQAGYIPASWGRQLLSGAWQGFTTGWLVVLLSVPYNALGLPVCYGLLALGAGRFAAGSRRIGF